MSRHWKILAVGFMATNLVFACATFPHNQTAQNSTPTNLSSSIAKCPPLPPSFKTEDLFGTWVASYHGGNDTDTLVIRGDGTYRQTYDDPLASFHYESDWQKWSIEYRQSGYLRLHLEGMHRCDEFLSTCARQNGGINPEEFTAIDYCENQVIEMPDEVVLIVTGVPDIDKTAFPRGITLRQTRLAGSEWTWSFRLQDP